MSVAAITRAGDLTRVGIFHPETGRQPSSTLYFTGADPRRTITALAALYSWWQDGVPTERMSESLYGLALDGGRLMEHAWHIEKAVNLTTGEKSPAGQSASPSLLANRWGGLDQLHGQYDDKRQPMYLYGFSNKTGTLHRYRSTRSGVTTAGKVAGFGNVKGLTLIAQRPKDDVLLANTTTGSLITITVPRTTRMTTSVTRLRDRTWQGFERIVAEPCGNATVLLAIDDDTHRGYVYDIGHARGRATPISRWNMTVDTSDMSVVTSMYGDGTDPLRGA